MLYAKKKKAEKEGVVGAVLGLLASYTFASLLWVFLVCLFALGWARYVLLGRLFRVPAPKVPHGGRP